MLLLAGGKDHGEVGLSGPEPRSASGTVSPELWVSAHVLPDLPASAAQGVSASAPRLGSRPQNSCFFPHLFPLPSRPCILQKFSAKPIHPEIRRLLIASHHHDSRIGIFKEVSERSQLSTKKSAPLMVQSPVVWQAGCPLDVL